MTEAGASPPTRPPFLRTAAFTYGSNLAVGVLSFGNVLVTARILGPVGRGDLVFLVTVATLLSFVAGVGVHQANANFAGREPALRPALAGTSVVLALLLGGGLGLGVAGAMEFVPRLGGDVGSALRWGAAAAVPVLVLRLYLQLLAQADYAFTVTNLAWIATPLLNVVANGALAAAGALTVTAAFAIWAASQALQTAILAWWIGRRLAGFGAPRLGLARRMLAFGAKTHVGRIMQVGNYRIDQWLLGSLSGSRELGLYSVAVAWSEILFYLPTALAAVQRPDLVRLGRLEAGRRGAAVFRVAALLTAIAAAAMAVAAPLLTAGVFGEDFRGAIDDLRLLLPGAVGIVALKLLGDALTAQRLPLRGAIAMAVAFVLTVALDVVLIPRFGGAGAAAASTVAYLAGGAAMLVVFARAFRVRALRLVPRPGDVPALWAAARGRVRRASAGGGE